LRRPALRLGTGFRGEIATETCPCGRPGLRLRDFRPAEPPPPADAAHPPLDRSRQQADGAGLLAG
ncbi:MAG TPA: hypothetical protein VG672_12455, partial [Bryobacteraceae bacterium]|nr:hypothetical protein [Bryobacteraceae bacterium]